MRAEILYASKHVKKGVGVPLEEVMRVFENTNNIEEINVVVKQAAERLYVSWASVDVKDKASERIPIEELAREQDVLLRRHGPITDEHTNRVVGETLAYKIMQHPKTKSLGVLHLNKIHADSKFDDKIWEEIRNGTRKGSSVGGFNEEWGISVGEDGLPVKVLKDFHQYETASVYEPCNPWALNEAISVVAKSAKNLQEEPSEDKKPEDPMENNVPEPPVPPGFLPGEEKPESVIKETSAEEEKEPVPEKKDEDEPTMNEEIQKAFDGLNDTLKVVNARLDFIEKHVVKADPEPPKKDEEKKEEAPEEKKEAVEKAADPEPEKKDEEKKEEVEKACEDEKKPDKKEDEEEVKKNAPVAFTAERPVLAPAPAEVKKSLNPLDIATGQVKKSWTELNDLAKNLR